LRTVEWVVIAIAAIFVWSFLRSGGLSAQGSIGPTFAGYNGGNPFERGTYGGPNGGYYNGLSPFPVQGWSNTNQMPIDIGFVTPNGSQFQFAY